MTKYIRSLHNLIACIKYIFDDNTISIDTRLIILCLAGVMPDVKFNLWIDRIQQLDHLNAKYKEINGLAQLLGDLSREYIIACIMHVLDHDLNSDELQLFIRGSSKVDYSCEIKSALTIDNLTTGLNDVAAAKQIVTDILIQKLTNIETLHVNELLDIYLITRQNLDAITAYNALKVAITDILVLHGMMHADAQDYSDKLVTYSVGNLINTDNYYKNILHSYKHSATLR